MKIMQGNLKKLVRREEFENEKLREFGVNSESKVDGNLRKMEGKSICSSKVWDKWRLGMRFGVPARLGVCFNSLGVCYTSQMHLDDRFGPSLLQV